MRENKSSIYEGTAMRGTDYRTLIDRGRKAGLGTAELYSAMTARRPEGSDQVHGGTDGNGFVVGYDQQGQRVFRPSNGRSAGG
jgi:hypothetical protein